MGTGFSKKKKDTRLMQEQLMKMQSQMKNTEVSGTSGNGLVTVKLNGEGQLMQIKIKPECVDPEDVEGLEDLIKAAFNDASKQMQSKTFEGMPGMPDLSQFGL